MRRKPVMLHNQDKQIIGSAIDCNKNGQTRPTASHSDFTTKQYLQEDRDHFQMQDDKQNNSGFANFQSDHNSIRCNIKTTDCSGLRFKTQQGFEPMMIQSTYLGEEQAQVSGQPHRDPCLKFNRRLKTVASEHINQMEGQKSLTFGRARKIEPLASSLEYRQELKVKSQVLQQINVSKKARQALLGSQQQVQSCANHANKRAKYRLLANEVDVEDMVYCSKCAINLLQQGFRVEEIHSAQENLLRSKASYLVSIKASQTRPSELKQFEEQAAELAEMVEARLLSNAEGNEQVEELGRQLWQTESIYNQLVEKLQEMRNSHIAALSELKVNKSIRLDTERAQLTKVRSQLQQLKQDFRQDSFESALKGQPELRQIKQILCGIASQGTHSSSQLVSSLNVDEQISNILSQLTEFSLGIANGEQEIANDTGRLTPGPFRTLFHEDQASLTQTRRRSIYQDESTIY